MALASRIATLIAALALILCSAGSAFAQQNRERDIEAASRDIADIRTAISENEVEDPDGVEAQLRELRDGSRLRLGAIERELEAVRAQLDLLGAAPGENDPPETEFIAAERSGLESQIAQLNGQRTRVLANIYESGELLARLSGAQLGALYGSLIEPSPSLLSPALWGGAWNSAVEVSGRISRYFAQWSEAKRVDGAYGRALAVIFGALAVSLLLFGPVNRWVVGTFSAAVEKRKPSPARRVVVAGLKMAARTAPGVIGGLIIIETLRAQGLLTEEGETAARAFWVGALSILIVSGFTAGFFVPASQDWRIAPIDAGRARAVSRLALAIVTLFSLKTLLVAIGDAAKAEESLILVTKAAAAIAIGACLFFISRSGLWRNADTVPTAGWRAVRRSGRALGLIIAGSALAGYAALADFLATRVVFLALVLGLAWMLRAMLAELALWFRARLSVDEQEDDGQESENYKFWSRLIINLSLMVALAPAILVLFGVPGATVRDIAGQALFGFNIGGVHIPSVAKLISAVVVFIAIMALTKMIQSGVQRGPLAHLRADSGGQNSLITLLGYAGLVVALFASISSLGFDLGNLALIAGALSVGIGFGLQSIVNNFVSGLILLFERPIKVGDWVVTPSGEGTVKKISVRSTEIETFDRSSIIVPNSELISQTVTNWTHKDKIGRIIVPVGVAYGSDPEQVREILLKCAREHPLVVAFPEPFVTWMNFGDSSLDFELRAFLNDISKGLGVRTDLRFAIFKAFKEAGVEIPFPQRDVYIKSLPGMNGVPEPEHKDKPKDGAAQKKYPPQEHVDDAEADEDES